MSNSKRPGGPGGPRGMRKGPKAKNPMKTLKRIFAIIVKGYPIQCVLVIIGIVVGVLANVYGSLFLQSLIDDYITPLVGSSAPDFTPLLKALATMAVTVLTDSLPHRPASGLRKPGFGLESCGIRTCSSVWMASLPGFSSGRSER